MFTPPPSPLPRGMAGAASMLELPSPETQDFLLPPPASSPRSPSPTRSAFFPSSPSSSSAPGSSSSSPVHHHDPTPFRHAIFHNEKLKVPIALSPPQLLLAQRGPSKSTTTAKKAQGRQLRILAFVVPVVLIALTLLSQRIQWRHRTPTAPSLWKRAPGPGDDQSGTSSGSSTTTDLASLSTSGATPTPTATNGTPEAPASDADVPVPTPFPQPFDASLSTNFTTTSCYDFFATFTQSRAFRSCRSFGLLFANSREFFQASSNLSSMNSIVWGTCHTRTERATCEATMTNLATELKTSACKEDLKAGNALAIAALVGFSNYALYRDAGCIINPRTNAYCYIEALAAPAPNDVYMYSLPLGINYPGGAEPTCSKCSQAVMSVMRQYAGNATLPISQTYADTQNKTEPLCGAEYALPAVPTSAAAAGARSLGICAAITAAALALLFV